MTPTLKPCPFCGSDDLETVFADFPFVLCAGCGAEGPWHETTDRNDPSEAVSLWNTRTALSGLDAAMQGATAVSSGPDGRGTMRVVVCGFPPGAEMNLCELLAASLGDQT